MKVSEDSVRDSLINPYHVVNFAEHLFSDKGTTVAKEDWVSANVGLIQEMGASDWLKGLLVCLTVEPTDDPAQMVTSPRQAVVFSERLRGEHEPMVDTPMWIVANEKLIGELGAEEWLWWLLAILETGSKTV